MQSARDLQSPPLEVLYQQIFGEDHKPERVHSALTGGHIYRDWLDAAEQDAVLTNMQEANWFLHQESDQVMLFGNFPDWATQLAQRLPADLLPDKLGPFNQMTVNEYHSERGQV
ncbi:hypothetical protein WJX73_004289 [Symbiochloris irregularis]|uniref:Uncharacterized protein n=1 Tax=Symbiochloris irregularis TaxID=706552 RepID=A0AAW1P8V3_9CHLO